MQQRQLSRRAVATRIMVMIAALSCQDPSGPDRSPGINVLSAPPTTGVIETDAGSLVAVVRDSAGVLAPPGTNVVFGGVKVGTETPEMFVKPASSPNFGYAFVANVPVDSTGRATALVRFGFKAGTARLTISALGFTDTVYFTALPGPPVRVVVEPADTTLYVGESFSARGGLADARGNIVNESTTTWTTAATGISVDKGIVTANAIGRYTLIGTSGGMSSTAAISVVPRGTLTAVRIPPGLSDGPAQVVSMELDGSSYRELATITLSVLGDIGRPAWIPGTNSVVFAQHDGTTNRLRRVGPAETVTTLIGNPPATMTRQSEPSPAANAPVIYFSAFDTRCSAVFYCLHRANIDGSAPELLGTLIAPGEVTWRPASSPDGNRVAFVTTNTVIKVFDYPSKTVSTWSVPGQHPSWSPDGSLIASVPQGGGALRVMNPDGTNLRVIPTGTRVYNENTIGWTADSKWLIARGNGGVLDLVEVATGAVLPLGYSTQLSSPRLK